jgi:Carboxypeptidase regulatory-like domain
VTATQTETGVKRTVLTDNGGFFVIPNLALGPYRLEATKTGFKTFVQMGLVLVVGSNLSIPVNLGVGRISDQIIVEANASQVETRSAGVGTSVMESQQIQDLPLNGRQATDLITLSGLAVQTGGAPTYTMYTGVNISVAGSTSWSVQYNLDGAPNVDAYVGTNMPIPFPDSLQEFKLSTSAQDPSFGGHSGATVDAVTKSGTNGWHGDLFEFFRNSDVNGRDFFAAVRTS